MPRFRVGAIVKVTDKPRKGGDVTWCRNNAGTRFRILGVQGNRPFPYRAEPVNTSEYLGTTALRESEIDPDVEYLFEENM